MSKCWNWPGHRDRQGYGKVGKRLAHRLVYQAALGEPIPDGMVIDHLCRNPSCVNPEHLDVVTPEENTKRGLRANATHCIHGHPFDATNTYISAQGRSCRACNRAAQRRRQRRLRATV